MKRSKFNLGYTKLFSCDMGELIPCGLMEVLPGDSIQMGTDCLVRCAPMVAPVMHPVDVRIHHWFVPHRLSWVSFEDFITGGPDGNDATVWPRLNTPTVTEGSLLDYLGLPPGVNANSVSALPARAYATIWNEWYRDQDLQTALTVSTAAGSDSTTSLALQNCDWEKDYFTSSRPWEQKGPQVNLPLGTTAPIKGIGFNGTTSDAGAGLSMRETSPNPNRTYSHGMATNATNLAFIETDGNGATGKPIVVADLTNATSVTVNQLRQSLAIQRFEEARARYGSRYSEYLRYLGVTSSDARLQRPEFLGGGRARIQFSEVLQTASSGTAPVASMYGHGITALRSNSFRRFFEEHGYIMSLMSVRPKTVYSQAVPRHWVKTAKTDYWQRELEHIGQQAVTNREVWGLAPSPGATFGYQDRYDEYRRNESGVAGQFRSTLNIWHMGRDFASQPALNSSFVGCVPTERGFAVPADDVIYVQARHRIAARRLVSQVGSSFIF